MVEKLIKQRFSPLVDVLISLDLLLGVLLGEACRLYYYWPPIDKVYHVFAAFQIGVVGYALAKLFLSKFNHGEHQLAFALVFAFFFSLAIQAAWELFEYAYDVLAGTNMQKYLPEDFYLAIDGNGDIALSSEEIAEFYRHFGGYHYAVEDTMGDIVADIGGAALSVVFLPVLFRFHPEYEDRILFLKEAEGELEIQAGS